MQHCFDELKAVTYTAPIKKFKSTNFPENSHHAVSHQFRHDEEFRRNIAQTIEKFVNLATATSAEW